MNSSNHSVCISIAPRTMAECRRLLKGIPFAEIRMESFLPSEEEIKAIFGDGKKRIATCRPGHCPEEQRIRILEAAIQSGASHLDIEIESLPRLRPLIRLARSQNCRIHISYHNFQKTPSADRLKKIVQHAFQNGADIAKIACRTKSSRDNARLLGLLDHPRPVIAIGMGKKGRLTRILGPLLGSPFSYAAHSRGKKTAPGQLNEKTIQKIQAVLK